MSETLDLLRAAEWLVAEEEVEPPPPAVNVDELKAAGFSDKEIELIRQHGLTDDVPVTKPVTRLEDVERIGSVMIKLDREAADVARTAKIRIFALNARKRLLDYRYGEQMRLLVKQHLPRRADGKELEKYVDLVSLRAGFRQNPSHWIIYDQAKLLKHILDLDFAGALPEELAVAVRSVTTLNGREAVEDLSTNPNAVGSVLVSLVQVYLAAVGTNEVNPETGEITQQREPLPGLTWHEGEQTFYVDPPRQPKEKKSK